MFCYNEDSEFLSFRSSVCPGVVNKDAALRTCDISLLAIFDNDEKEEHGKLRGNRFSVVHSFLIMGGV